MAKENFPRTKIANLSVSRMIIGTNNVLGGSHRTKARDMHIKGLFKDSESAACLIESYLDHGVDTIIGCITEAPFLVDGIKLAQDRRGQKIYYIQLGIFDVSDTAAARQEAEAYMKFCRSNGCDIFMPLHTCVEELLNKHTRKIDRIGDYTDMIRNQ